MHVYPDLQLSILIIIIDCDSRGLYYTIVGGEPWNHVRLKSVISMQSNEGSL